MTFSASWLLKPSFRFATEYNSQMDALKMIVRATSLGDVHSMALYPVMSSHRELAPKHRERMGIGENLVRLSIGNRSARGHHRGPGSGAGLIRPAGSRETSGSHGDFAETLPVRYCTGTLKILRWAVNFGNAQTEAFGPGNSPGAGSSFAPGSLAASCAEWIPPGGSEGTTWPGRRGIA